MKDNNLSYSNEGKTVDAVKGFVKGLFSPKEATRAEELHRRMGLVARDVGGSHMLHTKTADEIAKELELNKGEHIGIHGDKGEFRIIHHDGSEDVVNVKDVGKSTRTNGTTELLSDDDVDEILKRKKGDKKAEGEDKDKGDKKKEDKEDEEKDGKWSTKKKLAVGGAAVAGTAAVGYGIHKATEDFDPSYEVFGNETYTSFADKFPNRNYSMECGDDDLDADGWILEDDSDTPTDLDYLPSDGEPVIDKEVVLICCPQGVLSEDEESTESYVSRLEALGSAIVSTENAKLDTDLLSVLMNGNIIPHDSILHNDKTLREVLLSGTPLSMEAAEVIRDELKHEVIHLATGLSADSVISLNRQWKSINEQLTDIVTDMGKNANNPVRTNILTHYEYSSADKVSDGVVSGSHLIYSLLQLVNKSTLQHGVDKVCEKANSLIKSFVDTYGQDFYIEDMVIEKTGDLRYNFNEKTHPQENIKPDLYSADGESPTALGWKDKSPVKLKLKIEKAQQTLTKAFAHLDTLSTRPTHIAESMTRGDSSPMEDGDAIIFVSSLIRCISQILYRVVLWGSKLCEHSVDYIYKDVSKQ